MTKTKQTVRFLKNSLLEMTDGIDWDVSDFKDPYSNNHLIECKAYLIKAIGKLDDIARDEFERPQKNEVKI